MPAEYYHPGDECWLAAEVDNPFDPLAAAPLIVILDVGIGEYWFWPSWTHYPPGADYEEVSLPTGQLEISIIDPFIWPAGAGNAENFHFWAVIFNETFANPITQIASVTFGYGAR